MKPPSQNPSPQPPITISASSKPCSPSQTALVAPVVREGSALHPLQNHSPRSPTNSTYNSPPLTSLVAPAVPKDFSTKPQTLNTSPQCRVSPNPLPLTSLIVPEGQSLNPSAHKPSLTKFLPTPALLYTEIPLTPPFSSSFVHSTPNSHSPSPSPLGNSYFTKTFLTLRHSLFWDLVSCVF